MLRQRVLGALVAGLASAALPAIGASETSKSGSTECRSVGDQKVRAWQAVGPDGRITEVGVTIPMGLVESPPSQRGDGPAGAIAVVPFPSATQQTTWFDHFELHWNEHGHRPPVFGAPHFDFHFYAMPAEQVRRIDRVDPQPPAARMPPGYLYPGADSFEKEMGVHMLAPEDLQGEFRAVMVAGATAGKMHFLEPMATRKMLLERRSFTLAVPQPKDLGEATRYPTRFRADYDKASDSYRMVFSDFVHVPSPPVAPSRLVE